MAQISVHTFVQKGEMEESGDRARGGDDDDTDA